MRRGWLELLRSLGRALLELVQAEVEALAGDVRRTGRGLAVVVAIVAAAAAVLFWAVGALTLALIEVAALWLSAWGAALAVVGLLVLVAAVLLILARVRLRRLETPAATFKRHYEESAQWLSERVLDSGADRLPNGGGEE